MVSNGQITLLVAANICFAGGLLLSLLRLKTLREQHRAAAKVLIYLGTLLSIATIVWHGVDRGSWLPLEDNFNAMVWLGLVLAGFVLYVHATRPLPGLDLFALPIVLLIMISAAIFGRTRPHEYDTRSAWLWTHWVTAYGGFVAFAISAVTGLMYLIVHRKLRQKPPIPGPNLGSLERLEHMARTSVTLGFSLLTIGLITGVARIDDSTSLQLTSPKVLLTGAVWLIYAVVLHAPINPSFRGRKTAVLSVVGFLLMIAAIVAVQFAPEGKL